MISFSGVQAYLAGLTFALAISPCSSPILMTLLGYVVISKVHNYFLPLPFLLLLSFSWLPPSISHSYRKTRRTNYFLVKYAKVGLLIAMDKAY